MTGRITAYLPLSGRVFRLDRAAPPTLEFCQAFCGGDVQVVDVRIEGEPAQMVINEEAKGKGMHMNRAATAMWIAEQHRRAGRTLQDAQLDVIVGPALVLEGSARWR